MTEISLNRRRLLQTTGAIGVGTIPMVSDTATAQREVADGPTVYVGTTWLDDKLYAVDAETGEEVWRYDKGLYTPYSAPTVVNGTIYIGYDNGPRGSLHAVDAATGEQEWVFQAGDWVRTSPTVVDGTVYVAAHDEKLYAVATETGNKEWEFQMDDKGMHGGGSAVSAGVVYTGTSGGSFYAVDAATGEQIWKYDEASGGEPTLYEGTVYFGSDKLYALNAETGGEEWTFADADGFHTPTVLDGTVYTASGGDSESVYALTATTGDIEWQTPELSGKPTISDGNLYVSSDRTLAALDATSGDLNWEFTESTGRLFMPTVHDGVAYVGSKDNTLYAIDTITGEINWQFTNPTHHARIPTIVDSPDGGDSVGSRVNLGTLGHHHVWADKAAQDEDNLDEYRTDEGEVTVNLLFKAINDWRDGDLSDSQLSTLILEWREGN